MYGVQSATAPLGGMSHILPQRQGFSDVRKRFFRWDGRGRLIVGGPGTPGRPGSGLSFPFRLVERGLCKLFPEIGDVAFEHRWYARGAAAADFLPHLYEPEPGLFAALGFAGRGIAMGTMLGRALAGQVQGKTPQEIDFPLTPASLPFGLSALARW